MKVLPLLALVSMAQVAQGVSSSSLDWTPFNGNYDYHADQQTGQPSSDIVGDSSNYGFLMLFDDNGDALSTDGNLAFRIRLDAPGDNNNNFKNLAWVGIDADLNGSLDVFIGLDAPNSGGAPTLMIRDAGTGTNTSPNTTSISSTNYWSATGDSTNYSYRAVNFSDDGGTTNDVTGTGDPDYYLSFVVPFQEVVNFLNTQSISITDESPLRYVVGTSEQDNALNQDLGGVAGGLSSITSWEDLGGFTPAMTASGVLIPEPSSGLLAFGSLAGFLFLTRRR